MKHFSASLFSCLLLLCLGGCFPTITSQLVEQNNFNTWIKKFQRQIPLNLKQQAIFEQQYIVYITRVRQLQAIAEGELSTTAADQLSSFDRISSQAVLILPKLKEIHDERDWVQDLKLLSPFYATYIGSKKALQEGRYEQALNSLSNCPIQSKAVQVHKSKLITGFLRANHDNFERLKEAKEYIALAQSMATFKEVLDKYQIRAEQELYCNNNFTNYNQYLQALSLNIVQALRQSAIANAKDRLYPKAILELENAELLYRSLHDSIENVNTLINLKEQFRQEGIQWHQALKQQAEQANDFSQALLQTDFLCRLDKGMNCQLEKDRLQHLQYIKEVKAMYEAGNPIGAISKLKASPDFSKGRPETQQLLLAYSDEQGYKVLEEGDALLAKEEFQQAISRYKKAQTFLSQPSLAEDRIQDSKNRWGLNLIQEGDLLLTNNNYDEAIKEYETAKGLLSTQTLATEKIQTARDKKGRSMYPEAARYAAAGNCISAAETIKKAKPFVINKNEVDRLYQQYKECATKRIAIVLQADDPFFKQSNEKYQILDRLSNALKGEYRDVLYSSNLPVIGLNGNPFQYASQIGADQLLVVSFDKPRYVQKQDVQGTTMNFCYRMKVQLNNILQLVTSAYDYYPTPVTIYNDRADISMHISVKVVDVNQGSQPQVISRTISQSWSQESWFSNTRPENICYCPRGTAVGSLEKTKFVDASKFNLERKFPSGMDLLRSELLQTLAEMARAL